MLASNSLRIIRPFLIPKSAIAESTTGRRSVHEDFHGPDWDFKHHRVVETYADPKAPGYVRRGTILDRWRYYDQVVWRPEYRYPDGTAKEGEIFHMAENVKHSPTKLFYACQIVWGKSVGEADKQLAFTPRKAAIILRQLLKDAVDKAVDEHGIEYRSNLWVAECFPMDSINIKGMRRHARERWGEVTYRYSNLFVRLAEGKPPPYMTRQRPWRDGYDDGKKHLAELRDRRIKFGL